MSVKRHARKHRRHRPHRRPSRTGRLGFDYQEARLIVRPELGGDSLRSLLRISSRDQALEAWRSTTPLAQLAEIAAAAEELQLELKQQPVRLVVVRELQDDLEMMKKIHRDAGGQDLDAEPTESHDDDAAS